MIDFFRNITFMHPHFLWLLLVLPLLVYWYLKTHTKRYTSLHMPTMQGVNTVSWRGRLRALLPLLRLLALGALVVALARPRTTLKKENIKAEGIDIMLAVDLSSSMLAQDFAPNRLEASKVVATGFVQKRPHDRIGVVSFAGEALTQCPLTTDHSIVVDALAGLECGMLEDGTAIGSGLTTAINRLKDSEAKSKIVVLLTDGVNNAGHQSPQIAAKIAKELGVRVYTIGMGTKGRALAPTSFNTRGEYIFGRVEVKIDEALLKSVSRQTDGQYYRATNHQELLAIYDTINQLEKTEIDVTVISRYSEEFYLFVLLALVLVLLEGLLRYTVLRTLT